MPACLFLGCWWAGYSCSQRLPRQAAAPVHWACACPSGYVHWYPLASGVNLLGSKPALLWEVCLEEEAVTSSCLTFLMFSCRALGHCAHRMHSQVQLSLS